MRANPIATGALVLCALLADTANADILLNDTQINGFGGAVSASYSIAAGTGFALANAITVGAGGWNISDVSTFYAPLNATGNEFDVTTTAQLFIAPYSAKRYPVTPFTPSAYTVVPITFAAVTNTDMFSGLSFDQRKMTASGLNVRLEQGTYWFGLTPEVPATGDNPMFSSGAYGTLAAPAIWYRGDMGKWGPPYSLWTGPSQMMQIQGSVGPVPEPSTWALFGVGGVCFAWQLGRSSNQRIRKQVG